MTVMLYLLTVVIWGTTWIALKLQLGEVAIAASILYRFALAAGVLFVILLASRRLQPMGRKSHGLAVAQGLCLFSLNFVCFLHASEHIASGLVAVVFSTSTVWNALNARLWFGQRIRPQVLAGGAMGLLGLALLFWPELSRQRAGAETVLGVGLALLGTLCFSAGNLLSSLHQKRGIRPATSNAWGMGYGAALLAAWCVVSGTPLAFSTSPAYVGALLYLAIPGSVIAFTAYLTLVGRLGAERAAYCTVLFPLVALNVSAGYEGYAWSAPALFGLVLVLGGNVLVFRKGRAATPAAPSLKAA
ncbi:MULTISPECIES: DMT family transporter [Pseudomonas]|uniref:DMT family transporter n=1 Tax=Pseudomonas quercus TaxID=2722792 RepID=A0ABX0YAS6_9PSED|nr:MULTISPECIES: DMT family transporter [Pseudomonas]MBF7141872.1 DMT family transporter [Pseudomonas sp. LY10J]NJP00410.1 DMT family transporter [Pseudomonas quercus]